MGEIFICSGNFRVLGYAVYQPSQLRVTISYSQPLLSVIWAWLLALGSLALAAHIIVGVSCC